MGEQMGGINLTPRCFYEATADDGKCYGQITQRDRWRFRDTAKHVLMDATSLIDVGCFGGDWLAFILERRPSIQEHLGIDLSEKRIEEARGKFPHLNLRVAYAEKLDFAEARFDVVTCLEVLEHIPDWRVVLDSLFRLAARQVLITVPYRETLRQTPCIHCGRMTPIDGHLHSFSEKSFPELPGWVRHVRPLRVWDPEWPLHFKLRRLVRPAYRWLLADYRSGSGGAHNASLKALS